MSDNYQKNDPQTVRKLFGSIAERYDKTNAIMSLGLHKLWNRRLVEASFGSVPTGTLLDLCCGTGEITWTYLKKAKESRKVHLIDFCPEMLQVANKRALEGQWHKKHSLYFTEGDAEAIPLPDQSIDCCAIAYGIRNVRGRQHCFQELKRILRPGGRLGILELTRPTGLLQPLHALYLQTVIPILGKLCTDNKGAYNYLSTTISGFIEPEEMAGELEANSLKPLKLTPLSFGIAHLFVCTI